MEFLIKEDIIQINELTIEAHGGNFVPPFNFLHEGSLDYMLEAVNAELFGEPMYPLVSDKAAFYMYSIVTGHVFQDGNKRTGLEAALLFLSLNNYKFCDELKQVEKIGGELIPPINGTTDEILEHFTIQLASGKLSIEDCKQWFYQNLCNDKSTDLNIMALNDAD